MSYKGLGACPGVVVAPAYITDDLTKEPPKGVILVTYVTSPDIVTWMPNIKGIVTGRGGVLSHAAVIAREFGIPTVVGCDDISSLLAHPPRELMLRIDGSTGEVDIL